MRKNLYNLFRGFFEEEIKNEFGGFNFDKGKAQGTAEAKAHADELVSRRVQDKFSSQNWLVNPQHIFQVTTTGIAYLNQEPIKRDKARQLQREASVLKDTLLWSIFQETVRQKAIDQAMKASTAFEHVLPGKMMVYNLDIIESIRLAMEKIDVEKIPQNNDVVTVGQA